MNSLPVRILLNTLGIMLVIAAILLLLRGFGWLPTIPPHVITALLLLAIGAGILGGLKTGR